jgi:hypothetical protein
MRLHQLLLLSSSCGGRLNLHHHTKTLVEKKKNSRGKRKKTAREVERNHSSGTAGRYNTNKEDTNTRSGQVATPSEKTFYKYILRAK